MCTSQVTKGDQELQENIKYAIMNTTLITSISISIITFKKNKTKNSNNDSKRLEINAKSVQQTSTGKLFPSR